MPRSVYSDINSLSGLTTASTVSVYDILPTPADDRSDPLLHGTAVSKGRGLPHAPTPLDAVDVLDSYQDVSPYTYQAAPDIHIVQASSDDSIIPSPPPPTPPPKGPATLIHRRRSTKELIGMYESTSSSPSLSHATTILSPANRRQSDPLYNLTRSKTQGPKVQETRSPNEGRWNPATPMRNSFQNLLGVFGKKQKQPTKEFTVFRLPAKIPDSSPAPNVCISFPDYRMRADSSLVEVSTSSFDRGSANISVLLFVQFCFLETLYCRLVSSISSTLIYSTVAWNPSHLFHQSITLR